MWTFLRRIFCGYPPWAHGLECEICQVTFFSAREHYREAAERGTLHKHDGKIPVLRH